MYTMAGTIAEALKARPPKMPEACLSMSKRKLPDSNWATTPKISQVARRTNITRGWRRISRKLGSLWAG
jgi:hypothetical protein